jgi:aryl-alcohol dehydrogenase-like predicted oxidoreductase
MNKTPMQYDHIPGVEKPVPRLIQGAVGIDTKDQPAADALLDAIYEAGGTAFDTAHVYGQGKSERALGAWINARDLRDQVVVITKGAHHNADRNRVTPFDISSDLHDSLARLNTDYIDLYLLHRDDPTVPVEPIIDRLNQHRDEGKIKAFGASNWTDERVRAANDYAKANGLTPFAASSVQLSLAEMVKEPWPNCVSIGGPGGENARRWYQQENLPLLTWSSLAGGFMTGRFTRDNLDSFSEYLDTLAVHSYCYEDNFRRLDRARQLADEKGLTLPQLALAYVLNQPLNIFALVGTRSGAEFAENRNVLGVTLTPEELNWLDLKQDAQPV